MKSALGPLHWAQINEAGFAFGMRLLFWIRRTFGRWPFRIALYPVLTWYVLARAEARRASMDYLRRVRSFSGTTKGTIHVGHALRHFASFAECILDKLLLWGGLAHAGNTATFGAALLDEDIARGRGGLLICSHFGNLELCRVLGRKHPGLKMTVLVHTRHARKFNDMLARLDPASQVNLLQVTEMSPATAMLLSERVERGEFVVIAGDRVPVTPGKATCRASFLGAEAQFPIGPYVLASLLRCPVTLLFPLRVGDRVEVHFERLSERIALPRAGRLQACAIYAQAYAARLETYCMRAPYQWFNFYDFWHLTDMEASDASR